MHQAPKVSVVVPVYRPGQALERVVASLDAQTLPQDEFEVLFVDDGSPDETYQRLQRVAATRPNMHAMSIEHSGWPSRPRNVGIEHARGAYVLFMDHDDSLFPDALRSAYGFAASNDADILVIKESKTNDVWWGMATLDDGNLANSIDCGGIDRLQPMMPHKFYRRTMLIEHGIRFPEGNRVLWEDVFINVGAYRQAKVISVLADTPVYLWHASEHNSSHTFDPARIDFWDRIEDVLDYITSTLAGANWGTAHDAVLAWELGNRIIHRCVLLVTDPQRNDLPTRVRGLKRAQRLLRRYTSDACYNLLPKRQQTMFHLILAGNMGRIKAMRRAERALDVEVGATRLGWRDGSLTFDTTTRWGPVDTRVPTFRRSAGRVLRELGADLEGALPPELLDVTDDAASLTTQLAVRHRAARITWKLTHVSGPPRFDTDRNGALSLLQQGHTDLDPESAVYGRPLEDTVWDLRTKSDWLGMDRRGPLRFLGQPAPALRAQRPVVAYKNQLNGLSLDLAQQQRAFAIDAQPRRGSAGRIDAFSIPLDNVSYFDGVVLDAPILAAIPDTALLEQAGGDGSSPDLERLADAGSLNERIVSGSDGIRLEGSASLAPGSYTIYARRSGILQRTKRSLTVTADLEVEFS